MTVGAYTIRNDQVKILEDGQKTSVFAYVSVFKGGKQIDTMYPAKALFRKHQNEPMRTDAAIRRTVPEDLYLVLASYDLGTQGITLNVVVNPLVNWVWMGFGMLAFGTGIALLPESTFSFALAKVGSPEAAATTVALLLAVMLFGAPRPAFAQQMPSGLATIAPPKNALDQKLREEVGCTCGGCAHEPLWKCICGHADHMRDEVSEQATSGKSHDEVINYFVANKEQIGGRDVWGDHLFLLSPVDTGFNRLAWLFPYLLGGTGVVGVVLVAKRWSRRPQDAGPADAAPQDAAMNERLDDELRNLD
jgi:cytochrome c-type biogenesis protein CcmF